MSEPITGELLSSADNKPYKPQKLFTAASQVEEEMVHVKAQADAFWTKADNEKRALTDAESMEAERLKAYYKLLKEDELPKAKAHEEMVQDSLRRALVPAQQNPVVRTTPGVGTALETNGLPDVVTRELNAFSSDRFGGREQAHQAAYDTGQWFLATLLADPDAREYCMARPHLSSNIPGGMRQLMQQVVVTPSLGGYLVPEAVARTVLDVRDRVSAIASVARNYSMLEEKDNVPKRLTGLTVYKPGETAQVTPSEKTYGNVELDATDALTLTYISHKLIRGAVVDAVDDVISEIGYQFAAQQDFEGVNGDGTGGAPSWGITGMVNGIGTGGQITATGATSYGTITQEHIHQLIGALPDRFHTRSAGASDSGARGRPAFMCSHAFWADAIAPLMTNAGGSNASDMAGPLQFSYLGYPIVFTEEMPREYAGSQTCLLFGNYYEGLILGNREVVRVMLSDQFRFDYDQIAIKGRISYDMNFHEPGDASNAGAVVALVTPV